MTHVNQRNQLKIFLISLIQTGYFIEFITICETSIILMLQI